MAEFFAAEIAELIEQGLAFATDRAPGGLRVQETPSVFLARAESVYHASALGLALIARSGDPGLALRRWSEVSNTSPAGRFEAAARLLGISVALARLIDTNHSNGLNAAAIAYELRIGTLGMATSRSTTPVVRLYRKREANSKLAAGLPLRESKRNSPVPLVAATPWS
jgi:hypothetical protein